MVTTKLTTAEELARKPEDERYELIRGELRPMSPTGKPHGRILFAIGNPLSQFITEHQLGVLYGGDVGVVLERDPDTVLAPDIAFVRGEPVPLENEEEGYILLIPDLVIEIASPSDSRTSLRDKVGQYLAAGVPHVWLIEWRSRSVSCFRPGRPEQVLTEDDVLDGGEVLPGFRLPIAAIFR